MALVLDPARRTRAWRTAMVAAWAATVLFVGKGWLSPQPTVLGHSLGLTLVAVAAGLTAVETASANPGGFWVRAMEWAPLRETGRVSYEIYLLHLPAMDLARALVLGDGGLAPRLGPFVAVFAIYCAFSFAFGWLAHRLVGRPALRLKSRIGGRGDAGSAAADAEHR